MKDRKYTGLICKRFCSFYRPGRKGLKCGTYAFLQKTLSPGELSRIVEETPAGYDLSKDGAIRTLVCERCGFLAEDCGFRQKSISSFTAGFVATSWVGNKKNSVAPPCGGYRIVARILKESMSG